MPKQHSVDAATTCGSLCCAITHAEWGAEQVTWNGHVLTDDVSHATDFVALRRGIESCELRMRLGMRVDRAARSNDAEEIVGIGEKRTLVQKQRGGHLELGEQFRNSWVANISVVNGEEDDRVGRGNRGENWNCASSGKGTTGPFGQAAVVVVVVGGNVVGGSVVVSATVIAVFWPADCEASAPSISVRPQAVMSDTPSSSVVMPAKAAIAARIRFERRWRYMSW